jgi:hypothetical protein
MKNLFALFLLVSIVAVNQSYAQDTSNATDSRVITTALPFARIAADPRSAGMGDVGVATSVDAYSQQWNPAKYAFSECRILLGATYTPYLAQIVNDINLAQLVYANRINERSAFAGSIRFFGIGDVNLTDNQGNPQGVESPNEFLVDLSYSLRLSERFAMAVTGRYLRSDLRLQSAGPGVDATAANSFGVDITGYYQSEEIAYRDFNGRWRGGFAITNIGPRIQYEEGGPESFIPTNLGLGGGFDFILNDGYSKIGVTAEVNKLLVPTPPVTDANGVIIDGEDDDVGFAQGIFQSFGDAPGGFEEELREFTWGIGAEYTYDDSFAVRTGYFNESDDKGARKYLTLGAGFTLSSVVIDVSYLFSTGRINSPLENTLRFGLSFRFGCGEYDEY